KSYHKICYYMLASRGFPSGADAEESASRLDLGRGGSGTDPAHRRRHEQMQIVEVEHHQRPERSGQAGESDRRASVVEDEVTVLKAHQEVGMSLRIARHDGDQDPHAPVADAGDASQPELEDREALTVRPSLGDDLGGRLPIVDHAPDLRVG